MLVCSVLGLVRDRGLTSPASDGKISDPGLLCSSNTPADCVCAASPVARDGGWRWVVRIATRQVCVCGLKTNAVSCTCASVAYNGTVGCALSRVSFNIIGTHSGIAKVKTTQGLSDFGIPYLIWKE
jgi:hypothetical protein